MAATARPVSPPVPAAGMGMGTALGTLVMLVMEEPAGLTAIPDAGLTATPDPLPGMGIGLAGGGKEEPAGTWGARGAWGLNPAGAAGGGALGFGKVPKPEGGAATGAGVKPGGLRAGAGGVEPPPWETKAVLALMSSLVIFVGMGGVRAAGGGAGALGGATGGGAKGGKPPGFGAIAVGAVGGFTDIGGAGAGANFGAAGGGAGSFGAAGGGAGILATTGGVVGTGTVGASEGAAAGTSEGGGLGAALKPGGLRAGAVLTGEGVAKPMGRVTLSAAVGGLGVDMPGGGLAPKALTGTPGAAGFGGRLIRMVSFFNFPCPFKAAVPAAARLIVSLGMAEVGTVPGR